MCFLSHKKLITSLLKKKMKNRFLPFFLLLTFHPHACYGGSMPATVPSITCSQHSFRTWDEMRALSKMLCVGREVPSTRFLLSHNQNQIPPKTPPRPGNWVSMTALELPESPSMAVEEGAKSQGSRVLGGPTLGPHQPWGITESVAGPPYLPQAGFLPAVLIFSFRKTFLVGSDNLGDWD